MNINSLSSPKCFGGNTENSKDRRKNINRIVCERQQHGCVTVVSQRLSWFTHQRRVVTYERNTWKHMLYSRTPPRLNATIDKTSVDVYPHTKQACAACCLYQYLSTPTSQVTNIVVIHVLKRLLRQSQTPNTKRNSPYS